MRKRIAYSQNFIKDNNLISRLLDKSLITKDDIVYEIGAGQGIITDELVKRCHKVIAFEIDNNLYQKLIYRFKNNKNIEIKSGNFLNYTLPYTSYKVFSNIPFNITSAVIKKLTQGQNPPEDTYLIVQEEAAVKFMGKPWDDKNSQIATLLKPWFEMALIYHFEKNDFFPKPMVDVVLMKITKKVKPIINLKDKRKYEDFVVYTYNQFKPNVKEGLSNIFERKHLTKVMNDLGIYPNSKPTELDQIQWHGLFHSFINEVDTAHQKIVEGASGRLFNRQAEIEKIHRTRLDKDWKKYKLDKIITR